DSFELEARHAKVAEESFHRAGFGDGRARIHVGPALAKLRDIEYRGPFDVVFIDADKTGYPAYSAWAAEHLRLGGIVLGDNAFLFGEVADEPRGDRAEAIEAMRAFHHELARGGRFRSTILPTGEGLAFGVKVR